MKYRKMPQHEGAHAHNFACDFIFDPINEMKKRLDELWNETPDVAVDCLIEFLKDPTKLIGFSEEELQLIGDRWDILYNDACALKEQESRLEKLAYKYTKLTPRSMHDSDE